MIISGFQKTSFIDYSDKVASVIFTQGCNFNCLYCHNNQLITHDKHSLIKQEDIFTFLKKRKGQIDGVVISGGEPTLQKNLIPFTKKIKNLGYDIKLDTNGTNPEVIKKLLDFNLIDYIAMDIKAPLSKYNEITRVEASIKNILNSINLIKNSKIDYEFRTTVIKKYLNKEDIIKISEIIKGAKLYFLQYGIYNNVNYSKEEFFNLSQLCSDYVEKVKLR